MKHVGGNPLVPMTSKHKGTAQEHVEQTLKAELRQEQGMTPHQKITPQEMEQFIEKKIRVINDFLTPDKLREKLEGANLNHIGIYEGIMYDKLLALRGQPSNIISVQHQKKLDEVMPALLEEMKRRGIKAELTERTAIVEIPPA